MIPTGGPSHPWSRRACSPAYDSLTLSAGPCSGRSQTCAHPALMGGFYAPVFCWCDIRVMISDVKIIQLCWWVSPNGSYPSMASTTLGIKTHQSHYLLLSIFTDNWSRFLLLVIYSWCGSGRRNQSQSDHIKPMCVVYIWVVVIGPILVSIDLIALAMAMVISAEQPVMPSSLAAKLWEQGGTWQVLQCCMCCYYNIVHCVCHYIYILQHTCQKMFRVSGTST